MPRPIQTLSAAPISRFAFGTMQFGGTADTKASQAMFEACIEAGINHFDTAFVYTDGASETLLGQFVKTQREDVVVATKAAYVGGSGRANILSSFATSQQRLDLDYVDILYLHRYDPETPSEDTFDALAELKAQGKIGHIGLSNHAAWQVMKAIGVAAARGLSIDILQPMYNLVKRQAEVELLPMAQDQGILVAPYSPLGGGLLTGKYAGIDDKDTNGRLARDARYHTRYGQAWMWETAKALNTLAQDHGISPATLAAAWVAAHPTGPSPILSARSTAQLAPSLDAISFDMTETLYAALSALSPTPAPATDRLEEST